MTWLLVNCYGIRRAIKHFGVGWYRKIIHSNAALRITAHSKGFYSLLILQLYNNLYSIHSLDLYTQKTTTQRLIKYKPKANGVFVCVCLLALSMRSTMCHRLIQVSVADSQVACVEQRQSQGHIYHFTVFY